MSTQHDVNAQEGGVQRRTVGKDGTASGQRWTDSVKSALLASSICSIICLLPRDKKGPNPLIGKTGQELPAVRKSGDDVPSEDIAAKELVVLVIEQIADVETERESILKMIVGNKIDKIIGVNMPHKNSVCPGKVIHPSVLH